MKKRFFVLIAIGLIFLIMACTVPNILSPRSANVTATPTRTPKPTYTATTLPTNTLVPSDTPTPTLTPTITPIPTDTPLPTDTPPPSLTPTETLTPEPTDPPTATPRPTNRPTARPTTKPTPKPTSPPPLPFTGAIVAGWPNCGTKGVQGFVKHQGGAAFPGVTIGVWSDTWQGELSGPSELDGKYNVGLSNLPAGKFYVAAVNPDTCSIQDGLATAINCQRRSNVVTITVFEISECQKSGTVQWSEVHFTGP